MKKLQIEKILYDLYYECDSKQFNFYKSMSVSIDKYEAFKNMLNEEQNKLFEDYVISNAQYEDERCFEYGKFILKFLKCIFK